MHFDEPGVLAVNLMSSPGGQETSLLEATIRELAGGVANRGDRGRPRHRERRETASAPRCAGGASRPAMHATSTRRWCTTRCDLPLAGLDIVFVENVGKPGLPGELRPRRAPQRDLAAIGAGGDDSRPSIR
jgi:Ni2+-binding GTPase involved in maturation of urease and hydrogenase